MALVLKKWTVNKTANENEDFIHLVGRQGGVISWFLSLFKIDPVSEVMVSGRLIKFNSTSLAGKEKKIIPMTSVSSVYCCYEKPWQKALLLTIVLLLPIATPYNYFGGLGIIVGIVYYVLNKNLKVAIVESSGKVASFAFKRSVIEGQNIDENQAYEVIEIIRGLVENRAA